MHWSWNQVSLRLVIVLLAATAARTIPAQVVPAAQQGGVPIKVGAGFSSYYTEIFHKNLMGPTVWADFSLGRTPRGLRGLGIEAEARGLLWGQPAGNSWTVLTAGGGPIYSWRKYRNFQPYAKGLINFGAQKNIKSPRLPSLSVTRASSVSCVGCAEPHRRKRG
jgi:hypothetical protein